MTKIKTNLAKREVFGRKLNVLRKQGIIPVNIFGKKIDSVAAQITVVDFQKIHRQVGETGLLYITIEGESKERPCLFSNIQYHPITGYVIHIDFHQVDLSEKVTADIPVEIVGESPAVALENATIMTQLSDIEVEALPTDLPEKFVVDISKLEKVGDTIKISDLTYDTEKVHIELDKDTVIVAAQAQQAEEVVEAPVVAEGAESPAAEGEAKPGEATSEKPQAE